MKKAFGRLRGARLGAVIVGIVVFPFVALAGVTTYALLRRKWPDRALALVLCLFGVVIMLVWWVDYPRHWVGMVTGLVGARPFDGNDFFAVVIVGVGAGPVVGALTWQIIQTIRERSPYSGDNERERRLQTEGRRRRYLTHKAQAVRYGSARRDFSVPFSVPLGDKTGPYFGRYLRGDLAEQWRTSRMGGLVRWSPVSKHLVVLGGTGLGKTEQCLNLCEWGLTWDYQVIYLSLKEPANPAKAVAPRLAAITHAHQLPMRMLIPGYSPFDPMRGTADEIRDRLVKIEEWGDRYWTHCANLLVGLALELNERVGQPIQALPDLIQSLIRSRLADLSKTDPRVVELVNALDDRALSGAMTRYASLALHLRDWIAPADAGGWSFEDAPVICAELPTSSRPEASTALMRLMVRDLDAYLVSSRRQLREDGSARPVLMVIEEVGAVAKDPVLGPLFVNMVERARTADARLILSAQDPTGIGDDRTLSAVATNAAVLTYQQTRQAEAVARLAGTHIRDEGAALYNAAGEITKEGSTRKQHSMKLNPQTLRELKPGEFAVIAGGHFLIGAAGMNRTAYRLPRSEAVDQVIDLLRHRPEIAGPRQPQQIEAAAETDAERPVWS